MTNSPLFPTAIVYYGEGARQRRPYNMDTSETIGRILAGDEILFRRLVERYANLVWGVCSSYVPNWADREELAQEAFVQAYRKLDTLRDRSAFAPWLAQLTRRTCLDWCRKARREAEGRDRFARHAMIENPSNQDRDEPARRELHDLILGFVNGLPQSTREAMYLCYSEGMSVKDAAVALGVSADAVSKRLAYGRQLLLERAGLELEQALASEKHESKIVHKAMAAIPFGAAPWFGAANVGANAAGGIWAKAATIGEFAVMAKKSTIGIGLALAVIAALTLKFWWFESGDAAAPRPQTSPASQVAKAPDDTPMPAASDEPVSARAPESPASIPLEEGGIVTALETRMTSEATISGIVRDVDGGGIAGALVEFEVAPTGPAAGSTVLSATTDQEGAYEISGIRVRGEVSGFVYASAEGFVMGREQCKLSTDVNAARQDFRLKPAIHYVAGKVISDRQQPVVGASVGTLRYGYTEQELEDMKTTGRLRGAGSISSYKFFFDRTDEQGEFLVAVDREGFCDFTVTSEGQGAGFFPSIHTGTYDAVFVLESAGGIAGTVTDAEKQPVADVRVEVQGHAWPGGATVHEGQSLPLEPKFALTNADGSYQVDGLGEDFSYTVSIRNAVSAAQEDLPAAHGVAAVGWIVGKIYKDNESFSARRDEVRVRSGQVTTGVDLQLKPQQIARIFGTVKDRSTGKPVAAVGVFAVAVNDRSIGGLSMEQKFRGKKGKTAVTLEDGSYSMKIDDLTEKMSFAVTYDYFTEGGSSWAPVEEVVKVVDLGPDDEQQVDFRVNAPVTAPVRYVNPSGAPVPGILAAIRQYGKGGGCGGSLVSDDEGRVEFHGLPPGIELEVLAWRKIDSNIVVMGESEPFMGESGETVPEITVVCHPPGGIKGVMLDASGAPIPFTDFGIRMRRQDGVLIDGPAVSTGEGGAFTLHGAIPEDSYDALYFGRKAGEGFEMAIVEDVRVEPDSVTDLGPCTARPYTAEELAAVLAP